MATRQLNVYLHNKKVGILKETPSSALSFKYAPGVTTPISVRMPVREEVYSNKYAAPFFENLTPEGTPRKNVAAHFGISEKNNFSILAKIGGDCAGAISLYPAEPDFTQVPDKEEVWDEDQLATAIRSLPRNPLMVGLSNAPRLSLAGAQSKFVIHKDTKGNLWPSSETRPSTHIIKVENPEYPTLLYNELFCMKLAQKMWPRNSVDVQMKQVQGLKYLEIERYDRANKDGAFVRVHQEDFCQVLGRLSSQKYQEEGGPSIKQAYNALQEFTSASRAVDSMRFAQLLIFNFLIGNADAHAKNISLLHTERGVVLAPFYDLVSTEAEDEKLSKTISMFIDGKRSYEEITRNDFKNMFKSLGLNPERTLKDVLAPMENILCVAKDLKNELNASELTKSSVYEQIIALIERRQAVLFN